MYVKYKTVGEFYSSYRNKQPISLVATNNGLFYAIVTQSENSDQLFGIQVTIKSSKVIKELAMTFHSLYADFNQTDCDLSFVEKIRFQTTCYSYQNCVRRDTSQIITENQHSM